MQTSQVILLSSLFVLSSPAAAAQYKSDAMFGVRAGAQASKMTGVPGMLVSEGFYSGYEFTEEYSACPSACVFLSYAIHGTPVGLEARLNYDMLKARTTYDDVEGLTYTTEATFHTIGASAHIKAHPHKGLYLSAGIGCGWNLTPGNFSYSSNSADMDWGDAEVPTDEETAAELSEAFCGNGVVYLPLAIGYESRLGLSVEALWRVGLNDAVTTRPNRHDFGETENRVTTLGLLVGYAIPMDTPDRRRRR